jgi:hypothetical protein
MLSKVDNPAAPKLAQNLDSDAVRDLAGKMVQVYSKMKAEGFTPNEKLVNAINVLQTQGLDGLRELVRKGLAPSLVGLGVAAGSGETPPGQ